MQTFFIKNKKNSDAGWKFKQNLIHCRYENFDDNNDGFGAMFLCVLL